MIVQQLCAQTTRSMTMRSFWKSVNPLIVTFLVFQGIGAAAQGADKTKIVFAAEGDF